VTFDTSTRRVWLAAAFGALLAMAVGITLHRVPIGRGLVNWSYDLLFFARGSVPAQEAVIVYLDDASYGALQQPRNAPWDRALHARLIERLSAAGARAIVFDIIFSDPDTNHPALDERLGNAMKPARVIVSGCGAGRSFQKGSRDPFPLLLTNSAGAGSTEVA
jgi:CHASE2 domain-containing sensor protein